VPSMPLAGPPRVPSVSPLALHELNQNAHTHRADLHSSCPLSCDRCHGKKTEL
jgi:hypothetical protein